MENTTDKDSPVYKRCINCGACLPVNPNSKIAYNIITLPPKCQQILKHWTKYKDVSKYKLCKRCKDIIDEFLQNDDTSIPERRLGGQSCIGCGMSIKNKQVVKLKDEFIATAMKHWPWYTVFQIDNSICCNTCMRRLKRINAVQKKGEENDINVIEGTDRKESTNSDLRTNKYEIEIDTNKSVNTENKEVKNKTKCTYYVLSSDLMSETSKEIIQVSKPAEANKSNIVEPKTSKLLSGIVKKRILSKNIPMLDAISNSIILSDGKRTSNTKLCTISRGCPANSRKRIHKSKRRMVATNYDIYIPKDSRACPTHVQFEEYVPNDVEYYHRNFTVPQFESYIDELKQGPALIDFENVDTMADHICKYWTGIKVTEFVKMFESLNQPKLMKSALAAYLISKITGDSVQKLAKLFNISSVKLKKQIRGVEKHFQQLNK